MGAVAIIPEVLGAFLRCDSPSAYGAQTRECKRGMKIPLLCRCAGGNTNAAHLVLHCLQAQDVLKGVEGRPILEECRELERGSNSPARQC